MKAAASEDVAVGARVPGVMKLSASEVVGGDGALDVSARGATAMAVEVFPIGIEAFELGGVGNPGGMRWTGISAVAVAEPADCVVCACAAGDGLVEVPARGGAALAIEVLAIGIEASEFGSVGDAGGTCWTGISAVAVAEPADCGNAIVCAKLSASEVVGSDGALDVPARGRLLNSSTCSITALAKKPCKITKL